jgi:hypothetical protein
VFVQFAFVQFAFVQFAFVQFAFVQFAFVQFAFVQFAQCAGLRSRRALSDGKGRASRHRRETATTST